MPSAKVRVTALAVGLIFSGFTFGCSKSAPDPVVGGEEPPGPLTFEGTIVIQNAPGVGGVGTPQKAAGAEVRATVDRNHNRAVDSDEVFTAASDAEGKFKLTLNVSKGETIVVGFHHPDAAPLFRTFAGAPSSSVPLSISLNAMEQLNCDSGVAVNQTTQMRCSTQGNRLSLTGLGAGVSGKGRVFNPVTEVNAFPGNFSDSSGNLLLSGVFAVVEVEKDGQPLRKLDQPAALRMAMPRDTWGIVTDIQPGNDRIDVPLYAFDEVQGTWVREGQGFLEDGDGKVLEESKLASIRDGSFQGTVVATGEVSHFSYWNVDWPVESHACLGGRVVDASGAPAKGATVTVSGLSYNGTSRPVTVGDDGRFCLDVMRSEGPGEDVDGDGALGERQRVTLRVLHDGKLYRGGDFDTAVQQGTCGEAGCTDLGDIKLTEERRVVAALCTVKGAVRDLQGTPVAGASVYAWDATIESELFLSMCGQTYERCSWFATSAAEGRFQVSAPLVDMIQLNASSAQEISPGHQRYRWGGRSVQECPTGDVDLVLEQGWDYVQLDVAVNGGQITWTPETPVDFVYITDSMGMLKWAVELIAGIAPPITFGVVPPGATVRFPTDGSAPAALVAGDQVTIYVSSTGADGVSVIGSGTLIVP